MKIKVHEIEGGQYCSIDDIALEALKIHHPPLRRDEHLVHALKTFPVYIYYKSRVQTKCFTSYHVGKGEEVGISGLGNGLWRVAEWSISNESVHNKSTKNGSYLNEVEVTSVYANDATGSFRDKKNTQAYVLLKPIKTIGDCVPRPIYPQPDDCYLTLADTKIYLSQLEHLRFVNIKQPAQAENKKHPSTKTTNKQEAILTAIALLYHGADASSRLDPKKLATEIISDLNTKYSSLGIQKDLVTLETLEKYITNGLDRIAE